MIFFACMEITVKVMKHRMGWTFMMSEDQKGPGMARNACVDSTATTAAAYSTRGASTALMYTESPNTRAGRPWAER